MVYPDTAMTLSIDATIRDHLATSGSGWSIGAFGAIAEFIRDPDEALADQGPLVLATNRGAIRIVVPPDVRPVAYEMVSSRPDRWLHGVAFCLDEAAARMSVRQCLTEVGPDDDAVMDADRAAILFDIGTGAGNVNALLRTDDSALISFLREHVGQNVLAMPDVMATLVAANPQRVFVSRMGRIEVRQRIGSPAADPPTPEGPHTHVLPKVLSRRRTHSANLPIPPGTVPCLNLYPANPTFDMLGRPKKFDDAAFARFQLLLQAWGIPDATEAKNALVTAIETGMAPGGFQMQGRFARSAVRVALRQMVHRDGESGRLAQWRSVHDAPKYEPEDSHPDH